MKTCCDIWDKNIKNATDSNSVAKLEVASAASFGDYVSSEG
ncbi:MAG: hypothetical protein V4467_01415 [Patescibacteria group bacterium]